MICHEYSGNATGMPHFQTRLIWMNLVWDDWDLTLWHSSTALDQFVTFSVQWTTLASVNILWSRIFQTLFYYNILYPRNYDSHMLHGAGIFTYMTGWFVGQMLVNIPARWSIWDCYSYRWYWYHCQDCSHPSQANYSLVWGAKLTTWFVVLEAQTLRTFVQTKHNWSCIVKAYESKYLLTFLGSGWGIIYFYLKG